MEVSSVQIFNAATCDDTTSNEILLFRLGMGFIILSPEMFEAYMRIFLRRGKTRVAEKFLNGAEIRASLQQMRGEGMPQRVGCEVPAGGQPRPGFFDQ